MPGAFSSNFTPDNLPPKAKRAKKGTKNSAKNNTKKIYRSKDNFCA